MFQIVLAKQKYCIVQVAVTVYTTFLYLYRALIDECIRLVLTLHVVYYCLLYATI